VRYALAAAAVAAGLTGCGGRVDDRGAVRFDLRSRLLARTLHEVVLQARRGRPLLVLLHGRGAGTDGFLRQGLVSRLRELGPRAPAVLLLDGGGSSYFHDRRDGPWGSYVLREAIPVTLRRFRLDPRRVAIGGESMGGFGAFDLGRRRRFCAVGGHSAALWRTGAETPEGAFDDGDDFARNDVLGFARPGVYGRARVWIDVGRSDPFHDADVELARRLGVRPHVWPGGHGRSYWSEHLGAYLRFYAAALASCPGGG
jgi:poly(3-hydroxybutyrate) depolymerase